MEVGETASHRQEADTTGGYSEHEEDKPMISAGAENHGIQDPAPTPIRRKRRVKGEKLCAVCGDHAMSHNFGALTCETCKAFFRRNASRQKEIPACVFQDSCEINKTTRRFCAACRLKKCFTVGMNAELILDETERMARKRKGKTETESTSRRAEVTYTMASDQHDSLQTLTGHNTFAIEATQPPLPPLPVGLPAPQRPSDDDRLSPISAAISRFYGSTFTSAQYGASDSSLVDNISTSTQGAGSLQTTHTPSGSVASSHIQQGRSLPFQAYVAPCTQREQLRSRGREFQHVAREALPWDIKLYWPLTNDERQLLTQLSSAYQDIMMTVALPECDASQRVRSAQDITADDVIFSLDHSLRKCVRFSKSIPEFHQLHKADQISTLKASAMQISAIRATAFYVPEQSLWRNGLVGDINLPEALIVFNHHPCVTEFAQFCESLKSVAKTNCTLYALLHSLALFDVRDDKVEERVLVNTLKDKYLILLKHHLESEFSFMHADRYLTELLEILVDVRQVGQRMMGFYRQYSHLFKPLLAEIFTQ